MKITIFGMGYVGVVSGSCLLRDGHSVCGVDTAEQKVEALRTGVSPISEPQVAEFLMAGHEDGRLSATVDPVEGIRDADMVWICVGTPSSQDGSIDLSHVETVVRQIGVSMAACGHYPLVVLRSTVLPGTTESLVMPAIESASGTKIGEGVDVVFHPEFLREGTAVADFDDPPKIVAGESRSGAADRLMDIYEKYPGPRFRLSPGEAEMVKYCDNLFHALKITFANEVAGIASSIGVDSRKVAEVYCADRKLNISEKYLSPGFVYGGSCLPKDLKAILRFASDRALDLPMLSGIPESNEAQMARFLDRVIASAPKRAGMVGLSFKADTDDMRESPFVKVAKALVGEGIDLRIFDPGVNPDTLVGANKEQVSRALGHLEALLADTLDDLSECDLIMINHGTVSPEQVRSWLGKGIRVLDLVGIEGIDRSVDGYEGLYW